jgi:hypothetical protein
MKRRIAVSMLVVMCWAWPGCVLAQESHAPPPPDAPATTTAAGRPALPRDAAWAGVMVIVIVGGLFLPAAVIGPIARALAPEEEPQTTSHDEHGGSHHHPTDAHAPHGQHDAPAHSHH